MNWVGTGMLAGLILMALAATWLARNARQLKTALRAVVGGLLSINGIAVLLSVGSVLLSLTSPMTVLAQGATTTTTATASDWGPSLGAALATGLACIGAGISVGIAGAAAIGGITEKPEILGRTLIFVGLAEGIAIYGLIISFMILNR